MAKCKDTNISERKLLGNLLTMFKAPIRMGCLVWAESFRIMTSAESSMVGRYSNKPTPYMEYVYDCIDDPELPVIVATKSAQIGWSELTNNAIGKWIHTDPSKIIMAFPRLASARNYSREKIKPFFTGTKVLKDIINTKVAKESFNYFEFPNGFLKLITAGSVGEMKSSSIPRIIIEEPDDLKADVNGQGDSLDIVIERQKTIPTRRKKLIYGGTPTDKDFSKVEDAYKKSNQMVFKVECHECGELHELSFDNLHEDDYQDRYIDEIYGKKNPYSAYYLCPHCNTPWSFAQKKLNIISGMKHGNKGWHANRPDVKEIAGFSFNELLSSFEASHYIELSKKRILANLALEKGEEGKIKSFTNNNMGKAYASGITSMEVEEMKSLRKNYPEHVVPMEGLVLTAGIDVQDNRFAVVINAWGRNNNCYLTSWYEMFGDVKIQEVVDNKFTGIWGELTDRMLADIPHASGKSLKISAISIDSGDNTELVYKWVLAMQEHNPQVFATKGVRDLRYSEDGIYQEPSNVEIDRAKQHRVSLAETMGVTLFILGAHKCHEEILTRIGLNRNKEARSNMYFFNEQSYGMFEEQMLSCRKIADINSSYSKPVFKLVAGKRKEAMDACKNSFHAAYAIGLRNYTHDMWKAIEDYFYQSAPTSFNFKD
jgi:phage terminase large subunit GpA-like protein